MFTIIEHKRKETKREKGEPFDEQTRQIRTTILKKFKFKPQIAVESASANLTACKRHEPSREKPQDKTEENFSRDASVVNQSLYMTTSVSFVV